MSSQHKASSIAYAGAVVLAGFAIVTHQNPLQAIEHPVQAVGGPITISHRLAQLPGVVFNHASTTPAPATHVAGDVPPPTQLSPSSTPPRHRLPSQPTIHQGRVDGPHPSQGLHPEKVAYHPRATPTHRAPTQTRDVPAVIKASRPAKETRAEPVQHDRGNPHTRTFVLTTGTHRTNGDLNDNGKTHGNGHGPTPVPVSSAPTSGDGPLSGLPPVAVTLVPVTPAQTAWGTHHRDERTSGWQTGAEPSHQHRTPGAHRGHDGYDGYDGYRSEGRHRADVPTPHEQ